MFAGRLTHIGLTSLVSSSLFCLLTTATLSLAMPRQALAQDVIAPQVDDSRNQVEGVVNAPSVSVHSGAGGSYYATMKLDKGAPVTVVGKKGEWLKIVPPPGSFSYAAKAYIEKRGDGSAGRVTRKINVRAGSALVEAKQVVQTALEEGQDVQIVGEKDEYFLIKPPAGVYLYVNEQFVDPLRAVNPAGAEPIAAQPQPEAQATHDASAVAVEQTDTAPEMADSAEASAEQPTPNSADQMAAAPTTQGSDQAAPATQPVSAEAAFDQLEVQFADADKKTIEEQPVLDLLAGYEKLVNSGELPESLRRIAEYRYKTLQIRAESREAYLAHKKTQDESRQRAMTLKAEREELEEQIKQSEVRVFTAVGMLHTSSLQQGATPLYRLTDPATGRTVLYVRTDDAAVTALLGQFIGINGELTDEQLMMKVIHPTEAMVVDPNQLYRNVAATVVPPSMMPRGAEASTAGD